MKEIIGSNLILILTCGYTFLVGIGIGAAINEAIMRKETKMASLMTPKCKICKKRYPMFLESDIPMMVGFVQEDGNNINVCKYCIMKIGQMTEEEREKFFEEHNIRREK